MDVGSKSLGLNGTTAVGESVLILDGSELPNSLDRVLAVVEGPTEARLEVLAKLRAALGAGGPADHVSPGGEEAFLAGVLTVVESDREGSGSSVAVALCVGDQVVAGASGESRVVVFGGADGGIMSPAEDEPAYSEEPWRVRLFGGDAMVLLTGSIVESVSRDDIRMSVNGSDAAEAAAWLATLGCNRSHRHSAAVVGVRDPDQKALTRLGQLDPPLLPARSFAPPTKLVGLGVAAVAVLAISFIVVPFFGTRSSNANAFYPPGWLSRSFASRTDVVLNWQSRYGATDYQVRIFNQGYDSGVRDTGANASYDLSGVLPAGQSYSWRVRALFGTKDSRWVDGKPFTLPPGAAPARPIGIAPSGRLSPARAAHAPLCWTSPAGVQSFDLHISGGTQQQKLSLAPSQLARGALGVYCQSEAVPLGVRISWRVGARVPGRDESWSTWNHFFTAQRRIVVPVSNPVAPAATPVIASQPTTSTAPIVQQPVTSPPVTTTQPPTAPAATAPTAPSQVRPCSDPPHC